MALLDGCEYRVLDPTGNITALVTDPVPVIDQPRVASAVMARHAEVEQVGFLGWGHAADVDASLRMAGGEFCGNASMCAAVLFLERTGRAGEGADVLLRVSGAQDPVAVHVGPAGDGRFSTSVRMPRERFVSTERLELDDVAADVPFVCLEGISHLVVRPDSPLFGLRERPGDAERAVRAWHGVTGGDGLGVMFVEPMGDATRLTPLVFVPGAGTVFWERSCASGSAAVGTLMARELGAQVELDLVQPGGTLHVSSQPGGDTWLSGHVSLA